MKKKSQIHQILPDRIYNDIMVSKFINQVMKKGKKTIAQKIVYQSFDEIQKKTKKEPLDVFKEAINNTSPLLEVKPKRIGGATYQVPMEVNGDRRTTLAMRWIIGAAKTRAKKPMGEKLAEEIVDAYNNTGEAVKKKINVHRMAEANKAFAHFARAR